MSNCGHPCECPTYGAHLKTIGFAPSAMPSRHPRAVEINAREKRWDRDMDAYKRLCRDGLQPERIDGSAAVEATATERHHVKGSSL